MIKGLMLILSITIILILTMLYSAYAEKQKPPEKIDTSKSALNGQIDSVEYTAGKRRDPFKPLVVKSKPIIKETVDFSTFKLIGILSENSTYYAVLVFPDGKYYNMKEGMRLGIYDAIVYKVMRDSVIIREHIETKKGAIKTKDTILRLRKEEER